LAPPQTHSCPSLTIIYTMFGTTPHTLLPITHHHLHRVWHHPKHAFAHYSPSSTLFLAPPNTWSAPHHHLHYVWHHPKHAFAQYSPSSTLFLAPPNTWSTSNSCAWLLASFPASASFSAAATASLSSAGVLAIWPATSAKQHPCVGRNFSGETGGEVLKNYQWGEAFFNSCLAGHVSKAAHLQSRAKERRVQAHLQSRAKERRVQAHLQSRAKEQEFNLGRKMRNGRGGGELPHCVTNECFSLLTVSRSL